MAKIVTVAKISRISRSLKGKGEKIVLAGGCFDILHSGHVIFLEKAKQFGDFLIVMLESDQKVRLLKGEGKPIHNQKDRAKALESLKIVDLVVMLPFMIKDEEYDALIRKIKPAVIAATIKDGDVSHHKRVAKLVGAKLKLIAVQSEDQ